MHRSIKDYWKHSGGIDEEANLSAEVVGQIGQRAETYCVRCVILCTGSFCAFL